MGRKGRTSLPPAVVAVGHRFRDLRAKAGLTQDALAERMKVDTTTVSRIENGEVMLSLRKLFAAASAFGVAPAEFLAISEPLPELPRAALDAAPIVETWERLDRRHRAILLDVARSFAVASSMDRAPVAAVQDDAERLLAAEPESPDPTASTVEQPPDEPARRRR